MDVSLLLALMRVVWALMILLVGCIHFWLETRRLSPNELAPRVTKACAAFHGVAPTTAINNPHRRMLRGVPQCASCQVRLRSVLVAA